MSILPFALFSLAVVAAALTIWKSLSVALPLLRTLRGQLNETPEERSIHVTTLDLRSPPLGAPVETRRAHPLARHHRRPKPVTHRLHQFPHRTTAA
ncbi:hypothetical protein [Sphingobium sp.]|uniref:hypothetical protein n=1 Tax=Sphingobium sp. TaxID=1912891 RepID=UPI002D07153D|nr:hypothetical protein [Sphingobium sp.]HUD94183.1 hypothetical protein [Sphingobium sp.]